MNTPSLVGKIGAWWSVLRSGLWFVPGLFVLGGIALAAAAVFVDSLLPQQWSTKWPSLLGGGAEGSRGTLTAIAGSMITVAGVAFSITIVALSLASSQYTPRLLRGFMGDRTNQIVLGVFVGVFAYCLVVLRSIRSGEEEVRFVPSIAVWLAVTLAIVAIGFFIYFIHHIALSIQAAHILSSVARETLRSAERLYPERLDGDAGTEAGAAPAVPRGPWRALGAPTTGYVQRIDMNALASFASERQVVLRVDRGVGEFVIAGLPALSIYGSPELSDADREYLLDVYQVDRQRSIDHDPAFGVRQMVDVALKALSPGINDTTTAVMAIDHLTATLTTLAQRRMQPPHRIESSRTLVVGRGPTFTDIVADVFGQIRRSAEGHVVVLSRLIWSVETLAAVTSPPARRRALLSEVEAIGETGGRTIGSPADRAGLEAEVRRVARLLENVSGEKQPPS